MIKEKDPRDLYRRRDFVAEEKAEFMWGTDICHDKKDNVCWICGSPTDTVSFRNGQICKRCISEIISKD